tara:strand:+ start:1393 stop:1647 length:255 start_codon:yes stop_codon:yes gene_type:complete
MDFYIFILLLLWGVPSTFFRNKFRKIVYQTDDWKINIKPLFVKELKGLLFNLFPKDEKYIKVRNQYRVYLTVYLLLFIIYILVK